MAEGIFDEQDETRRENAMRGSLDILERIEAYDCSDGGHSDKAQGSAFEIMSDAADEIKALRKAVEAERARCIKICELVAKDLSGHSARAEMRGDADAMYRANTAWHRVNEVSKLIGRPDYLKQS